MVKKKRTVGDRAKVLLDSIDLQILEILAERKKTPTAYGIMDVLARTGLHHSSLKPHIDKLISAGLVVTHSEEKSNKVWLSLWYLEDDEDKYTTDQPVIDVLRRINREHHVKDVSEKLGKELKPKRIKQ